MKCLGQLVTEYYKCSTRLIFQGNKLQTEPPIMLRHSLEKLRITEEPQTQSGGALLK